jgi:zinc-ribbon domain
MLCPHCGSEVSDNTRSCPRCGAVLSIESPVLASTDVSREIPQQEQQVRRLFAVIFLAVICGIGAWFFLHRPADRKATTERSRGVVPMAQKITPANFSVDARTYRTYGATVGPECQSARIQGNVELLQSDKGRIELLVFDSRNFELWKNRHPTTVLYRASNSRNVVDIALPPNTRQYFVVFRNQSGAASALLQSDISIACVR